MAFSDMLAAKADDPQFGANLALAAGLISGNLPQGIMGFAQAMAEGRAQAQRGRYLDAQMAEIAAQTKEREIRAKREQAELDRQAGINAALPSLFRAGGYVGGDPLPQAMGGVPMFSLPMQSGSVQYQPPGFDLQQALKLRMTPKEIADAAALQNIGRPKVARTVKGLGPDGKEYEYQVDDYGQRVGEGLAQWKAPHYQDLGGEVGVFDGYGARTGSMSKSMTPGDVAADRRGWAGFNESRRHNLATEATAGLGVTYQQDAQGNIVALPTRSAPGESVRGVPVMAPGNGVQPLQGKPSEKVQAERLSINQQLALVDSAMAEVQKTPSAFGFSRGAATMAGVIPESIAGRMDTDAERQARAFVFNNVSAVINERAGAAQSAQELARLRSFLPAETDNAAQVTSKFKAFRNYLTRGTTTTTTTAPSAGALGSGTFGFTSDDIAAELARRSKK